MTEPIRRPRVVTVCGDPGGATAMAPVLEALELDGRVSLVNYAYSHAPWVLARASVPVRLLESSTCAQTAAKALDGADLLFTATSVNEFGIEKLFTKIARERRCRTVALLDFWSNYSERFSASTEDDGLSVPDVLAVMDTRAAAAIEAAGIRTEVRITGHPGLDGIDARRARFTPARRASVRDGLGASADDLVVLFISQALREISARVPALGFDQHQVLALVVATLADLGISRRLRLVVRPHPRESLNVPPSRERLPIVMDGELDGLDAALAADLVVGMNSVLLLQAAFAGACVLSLQPGLLQADMLPTNASGATRPAYRPEACRTLLRHYILSNESRQAQGAFARECAPGSGATERVCSCMYNELNMSMQAAG